MPRKTTKPRTIQEANAAIVEAANNVLPAIKEAKELSEERDAPVTVEEKQFEYSAVLVPVNASLPPAGNANPYKVLESATSEPAEKIISLKTPPDISNPTNVANEEEIAKLEREIDDKAAEIIGQFTDRIEYELLPLLYKMKSFLPHGEWGKWFERFRKRVRFQWTMRTVQRKFRELEDGWADDPDADADNDSGTGDEGQNESEDDSPSPVVYESPKELLTKWMERQRKTLLGGDGPVNADPIRDGERRVYTSLQMLDELKLAVDEGLLVKLPEDCGGCQHMHRGIVALAKANPDWTDERLAEETGNNVIKVRQARTRFMAWKEQRDDCQ